MGKNKLMKFAEMQTFPNVVQPKINKFPTEDFYLKGKWASDFFHNSNPIVLELGCGKGEFTVELAKRFPDKNFIGIDIKGARMWTGAKQALELGLNNVAFLRIRIEFLNFFFKDEVSEIYIPFPDPQPKKPRKRLVSPRFLNLYSQLIIEPSALVHLKTDNHYLFEYTLKVLEKNQIKPLVAIDDLYASDYQGIVKEVKTFYEAMFLEEGKKITYILFRLPKNKHWEDIPKNPAGSPYK